MGQCSTLPAEARPSSSVASRHESSVYHGKETGAMLEQRHRLKEEGRKESLDFNKLITPEQQHHHHPNEEVATHADKKGTTGSTRSTASTRSKEPHMIEPGPMHHQQERQSRDPETIRAAAESPIPMDVEDPRDQSPAAPPIPPPPEHAIRTRCYKLNLESESVGLSSSQKQSLHLGPFSEPPPFLTYSSSDDSSAGVNPTTVAIQTAQIFRGITVSRDGTILTQNARATRSNRGKGLKRGEKSRQAAKIDKAKDLVEETIASGKAPDSDDPAKMVSLVIVGEYDDMKYLVRDGSKKLREAEGLPDEHLLSINRPRTTTSQRPASSSTATAMLSPRKRVSPSLVNSQRNAALQSPEKIQATVAPLTPSTNPSSGLPQSAPPKLKGHPRDTRPGSSRRGDAPKVRLDSCHDFMDPRRATGGVGGDGDWSHAWNIWNCGGGGTVSPMQPSSPKDQTTTVYEGRESYGTSTREGAVSARAN